MRIMPEPCPLVSLRMTLTDPRDGDVIKSCGIFIDVISPQNPLPFRDGSHVLELQAVFERTFDTH